MAIYGTSVYGAYYGGSSSAPSSPDFDVYDFCYPTETVLPDILTFSGSIFYRYGAPDSFFSGGDFYMQSDDDILTGLRLDQPMAHGGYTFQFAFLPDSLPEDFSSLGTNRFFVGIFNYGGSAVGLLFSEEGGIALATDSETVLSVFPDSDRIMDATTYYVVRISVDEGTERANLFITRKDVLAVTGIHELRYTFTAPSSPLGSIDHAIVEVVGTAAAPTAIYLDCIRLSSQILLGNLRPIADIADADRSVRLGSYAYFDGRGSYDPDNPPAPLTFVWTLTNAPDDADSWKVGLGTTDSSSSGYINYITGSAGTFSEVTVGDLIIGTDFNSPVVYVSEDGDLLAAAGDIFEAGTVLRWSILSQSGWGGAWVEGTLVEVEDSGTSPPGTPVDDVYYLVLETASGDWTGQEGNLAMRSSVSGLWSFVTPPNDTVIYLKGDNDCYRLAGSGLWYADSPYDWELPHWEGRTAHIGSLLPTATGLYDIDLVVGDGVRHSLPALGIISCQAVESERNVIPDMSFLWKHLPGEFWDLVENKQIFETFWSATAQIYSGLLVELWQHQFALDLFRVQRTFQKHWLQYDTIVEEPSYSELPATIQNDFNVGGYSATPNIVPESAYAYDLGTSVANIDDSHYLVISGVSYKVLRVISGATTVLITEQPMPVGDDRAKYWRIAPTVASQILNFSERLVSAEDTAVFEVRSEDESTELVNCYIYGITGAVLSFDDSNISAHLLDDTKTVYLKYVQRRQTVDVDALVQSIPQLQEVINFGAVLGASTPLYEGRDYFIDSISSIVSAIDFIDTWKPVVLRGIDGETTALDTLEDTNVDFVTALGEVGTELSNYVIDIGGVHYRLSSVLGTNSVEFEAESIESGQTGLAWTIHQINTPPETLWAEITHTDNRPVIDANFGSLIGFGLDELNARTDELDYLSAVRGFWYYVYNARTLYGTRVAAQVALGLPFAEVAGTIIDVQEYDVTRTRILIRDTDDESVIRAYLFPTSVGTAINPLTAANYSIGDTVTQFAPLSGGVNVDDYVETPDWWLPYAGSGDFYEPQKLSTVGVTVNADVFDLTNVQFLIRFLRQHRVMHRDIFPSVLTERESAVSVGDSLVTGPAVLSGYTYPDDWDAYEIPYGFANSPHEWPRAPITDHYPTTPPVPVNHKTQFFGGLHFVDIPGLAPNIWQGAWPQGQLGTHEEAISEGNFQIASLDPRGRPVRQIGRYLTAVNLLSDDDFDSSDDPGDPGSPWDKVGSPASCGKVGSPSRSGNSLYTQDDYGAVGTEQTITGLNRDYQVAARLWVYLITGQAYIELIDDTTATLIDECRCGGAAYMGRWVQVTLHAWSIDEPDVGAATRDVTVRITTGPGGGEFYVDDSGLYSGLVPWTQVGLEAYFGKRTGGATEGALPDEDLTTLLAITHSVGLPKIGEGWPIGAASHPDKQRLAGPASAPLPPTDWTTPGVSEEVWRGPNYGNSIETWKNANGYTGYGSAATPTKAILIGVSIPGGWYTRIVDLNKRKA